MHLFYFRNFDVSPFACVLWVYLLSSVLKFIGALWNSNCALGVWSVWSSQQKLVLADCGGRIQLYPEQVKSGSSRNRERQWYHLDSGTQPVWDWNKSCEYDPVFLRETDRHTLTHTLAWLHKHSSIHRWGQGDGDDEGIWGSCNVKFCSNPLQNAICFNT